MAVCNIYVFAFFTALVAVNLIFAEENSLDQEFLDQADISADAEREARSPNEERLFFNLPIPTTCNFTTQGRITCTNCSQALRCYPNNIGLIRNCHGLLPYCVNGQCTFYPSANCTSG